MRVVTEEERRALNLELLLFFDKVCRENNIKYSVTGGTLLGAVRHKGFIPWDDDVDVFLSRTEFDKLDAAFGKQTEYTWKSPTHTPDFELPFARLFDKKTVMYGTPSASGEGRGLFLDVSPVDGLPDSSFKQKLHIAFMRFYWRNRRTVVYDKTRDDYYEGSIPKRIYKFVISHTTNLAFWMKKIKKRQIKYPFDTGMYVGNFTSQYGKRERMHHTSWEDYVELEFEGHSVMACVGWEEYLKNIYGDYMKLPPEDQRYGHHDGDVFWIEEGDDPDTVGSPEEIARQAALRAEAKK